MLLSTSPEVICIAVTHSKCRQRPEFLHRRSLFRQFEHPTSPAGTRAALEVGHDLVPGHRSHFRPGQALLHVYFTALVETAVWGAELAAALHPGGGDGLGMSRERIYVVEPQGPFEDDPNVTDKKLPGNPTESYRTTHPLRVVGELDSWEGHSPEVLQRMLDGLTRLRAQGLDLIED
jgi:hypothetical protein